MRDRIEIIAGDWHNINKIIVISLDVERSFGTYTSYSKAEYYCYRELAEQYNEKFSDSLFQFYIANISYMYNYANAENSGYYWIDDCQNGEYIFKPTDPARDGYAFTGWYQDEECSELYDLENQPFVEEMEELTLYAGWQKN